MGFWMAVGKKRQGGGRRERTGITPVWRPTPSSLQEEGQRGAKPHLLSQHRTPGIPGALELCRLIHTKGKYYTAANIPAGPEERSIVAILLLFSAFHDLPHILTF